MKHKLSVFTLLVTAVLFAAVFVSCELSLDDFLGGDGTTFPGDVEFPGVDELFQAFVDVDLANTDVYSFVGEYVEDYGVIRIKPTDEDGCYSLASVSKSSLPVIYFTVTGFPIEIEGFGSITIVGDNLHVDYGEGGVIKRQRVLNQAFRL